MQYIWIKRKDTLRLTSLPGLKAALLLKEEAMGAQTSASTCA
jgi:hypothetical protein